MKPIFSLSILLFAFFLAPFFTYAQLSPQQIDSVVNKTMDTFNVPGMAVAVLKDGKIISSKGYGIQSIETQKPVDTQTLFGIASNTKAFTTAALAQLIDEGKLSWDTKVIEIIPEFSLYDPYITREATIRDLVSHRLGLGLGMGDLMVLPGSNTTSLNEMMYKLRYLKPVSSLRAQYHYNNLMFVVAGEVITRVSGQDYEDYIEAHFFKPLRMKRATMDFDKIAQDNNRIDGHAPVNGELKITPGTFSETGKPAAGIYASIDAVSKWVEARINYGKYGENLQDSLFSKRQAHIMWTPQTITGASFEPYDTHFAAYGMGWGLKDVKGYLQASHTGGLFGIVSQITIIPELKLGVIVLTNQESGAAFTAVTNSILDGYFGIEGEDRIAQYNKNRLKGEERTKKVVDAVQKVLDHNKKSDGLKIDQIAGTYQDEWYGKVEIKQTGKNKIRFTSEKSTTMSGDLQFYKGTTYVIHWDDPSMNADAFINFNLNPEAKAIGFTLEAVSPATDFSFDFQDLAFKRIDG